ncbi:MAG: VCBS repeat-containing protein [Rhodospirillaceae bacterium]|nr:VCBS repeat-containing protein [Rhodospirillaceae bacterium]
MRSFRILGAGLLLACLNWGAPPAQANILREGAVFSSTQAGSHSFLRFVNTGARAGTVTLTLFNATNGAALAQWTSPSIPAGATTQYPITTIENGATATFAKPNYYSIIVYPGITGYFQHVLYRPADGTLTNLSTCNTAGTADARQINSVHSTILDFGFPSSVVVNNTGANAATVRLGVFDATTGARLGTYTTPSVAGGGHAMISVSAIQESAGITPSSSQYHYVIKAEGVFNGYLQHLVNNKSSGVITDMTTVCPLTREAARQPPPTLKQGAVFSTGQAASRSYLRFTNTGSAAGTVSVTLANGETGQTYASWTSPSIPANASAQYFISELEAGAAPNAVKPGTYSMTISGSMSGYFQHVLWRPADGTLTNLSTCGSGITTNGGRLINVHSTLLDDGYPSSVVVVNTGATAMTVQLGVFDATTGERLGAYTTPAIAANSQQIIPIAAIQTGAGVTPTSAQFHYVIKAESGLTGYLQHLVNNKSTGVITDMTTVCRLPATEGPMTYTYTELSQRLTLSSTANAFLARLDLTGDGLDDLIVSGENPNNLNKDSILALRSNGDGTFTDISATIFQGTPRASKPIGLTGDYNGDGREDIAVFDAGNQELGQDPAGGFYGGTPTLLLSNADGTYAVLNTLANLVQAYRGAPELHGKSGAVGDIDGDGDLDMYFEAGGGYSLINNNPNNYLIGHFYINDGRGNFTINYNDRLKTSVLQCACNGNFSWRYSHHLLTDMNNDSFPDLVMGRLKRINNNQDELKNKVILNDGHGYFPEANKVDLPGVTFNNDYTQIGALLAEDLDGDGRKDLILEHERGGSSNPDNGNTGRYLQVLMNTVQGWTDASQTAIGDQTAMLAVELAPYGKLFPRPDPMLFEDMNNDGRPDIVMAGSNTPMSSAAAFVHLQRSGARFTPQDPELIAKGRTFVGQYAYPIDLDGNGVMDMVAFTLLPGADGTYNTGDEVSQLIATMVTLPQ